MKTEEKLLLVYGLSMLGAGALAYSKGRRETLLQDALLGGLVLGTGASAALLLYESHTGHALLANSAVAEGTGALGPKAVSLLEDISVKAEKDNLWSQSKANGVKVGLVPQDAAIINQDAT